MTSLFLLTVLSRRGRGLNVSKHAWKSKHYGRTILQYGYIPIESYESPIEALCMYV